MFNYEIRKSKEGKVFLLFLQDINERKLMEVLIASNMDELDSKSSFDDSYKLFRCELGTFEIWKDNWGTLSIHSEDEKVIYFLGALFEEQGLKLV